MTATALPVLLTINRVAEILDCHPETVRRAIRALITQQEPDAR